MHRSLIGLLVVIAGIAGAVFLFRKPGAPVHGTVPAPQPVAAGAPAATPPASITAQVAVASNAAPPPAESMRRPTGGRTVYRSRSIPAGGTP
jgi:hypothetical protein